MNYGRFFEFDFESSRLDEGIAVFNYRWLKDIEGHQSTNTPKHPIYLTFTSEAIVFNLHYMDKNKTKTGMHIHYHNPIIELFLSPNIEISDGLSETLNETYFSDFPVKANDPLRKIIRQSYIASEQGAEETTFPDNYSSLEVFQSETSADYEDKSGFDGIKPTHFLRKLMLDFLYDFEFTSVFKNLSFYNEVSIKLRENFLFNALMNKTRYYYYRTRLIGSELFSMLQENEENPTHSRLHKNLRFLFQRYEAAEREWVESITNDKAMEAFHESPWFEECHEELEQVFLVQRLRLLQKHKKQSRESQNHSSAKQWFAIPVPPTPAIPSEHKDTKSRFLRKAGISPGHTFHLTVSNLLNLIQKQPDKETKSLIKDKHNAFRKAIDSHHNSALKAARWDVEHYQFPSLLRVWCGDRKTILLSILILILMAGSLIGIFFLIHRSDWGQTGSDIVGWQVIIIAVTALVMLYILSRVMRKFRRSTWGIGFPSLTMPRLLAAIVTAWFTISLSEDLFIKLSDRPFSLSAVTILSLTTCFFIAYESYTLNPYDNFRHHFIAAIWVFALAYGYAIVTGLLVYDFFGERFIEVYQRELTIQGNELNRLCQELPSRKEVVETAYLARRILGWEPNKHVFITQFSFFATFIGIFLQLMLQGKHITKSE